MAISGLQYAGFVVNYLEIAPPFSGTVMGTGNTLSALAGILSPALTSVLAPQVSFGFLELCYSQYPGYARRMAKGSVDNILDLVLRRVHVCHVRIWRCSTMGQIDS